MKKINGIYLFFILMILFGCHNNVLFGPTRTASYIITDKDKKWIPYEYGDTLIFESNKGNIARYIVDTYDELEYNGYNDDTDTLVDFKWTMIQINISNLSHKEDGGEGGQLLIEKYPPTDKNPDGFNLSAEWSCNTLPNTSPLAWFDVFSEETKGKQLDSITTKGKTYHDVIIYETGNNQPSEYGAINNRIYYSKKYGFIRFENIYGEI